MARSWHLWRRKTGRHALGAAVTELPSGPLRAVAAPPVPVPVPAAAPEPGLAASIAELISSGEAWNVPVSQLPELPPAAPPREPPAFGPPRVDPPRVGPPAVEPPRVDPPPAPVSAAPPAAAAPVLARVQLGFRDGTSTSLDPSSSQSQALEQLAHSLTHRD